MGKTKTALVLVPALLAIIACSKSGMKKNPETGAPYPVSICYVREMEYLPELNGWQTCEKSEFEEEVQKALVAWENVMPWVVSRITPETAQALSQWAHKEMEQYAAVPPLSGVLFTPVRYNPDHRMLVFEGTVDTLPAHSPIVTRWLKLFLLYDTTTQQILRVTVTIQGEILE